MTPDAGIRPRPAGDGSGASRAGGGAASDLCGPPEEAVSLAPDEVHALNGPIYARKFALDYARPRREELLAHFAAVGLTGPSWQL